MIEDLAKARVMLESTREAIRTTPELRPLADKLERMAGEVARIEKMIALKLAATPAVLR